ncbi:angiopoietin-4-like [Thalassophryne amazonica]|uniref:angiopoietin-4-like n=1 Tax=Thalassophryne amazonica TaxID=390379 RepID=UPI00147170CC|nr:angiopoietin-4-like [Thalassophryne amazonica]
MRRMIIAVDGNTDQTRNHSISSTPVQCGEYNSELMANGQCRLMATLPPVGTTQKHCPDMFRCTDDVSYWLHENQNRKEQLEELREMMSELQEELRSHRHHVKALEMQNEESVGFNSSFDRRFRFLELRHAEVDTLLHVHAALLYELQAQLRNLSDTVQRLNHNTGCKVNIVRSALPVDMRDMLPPDGPHMSFCPSDCASLYHRGVRRSGVYTVILSAGATVSVFCDMETEGGGWTVFQRRHDGSVSFNRGWSEYRDGFGEPRGEHWLGNQQLHLLSNHGHYSLRIDLQDWSHTHKYALYHNFRIDDEENQYHLHVSGFSGTVEDSFGWYHDQHRFSTPDTGNICAEISHAGWWFHQCFYANLNGIYYKVEHVPAPVHHAVTVITAETGGRYSLKAQNLLGPDGIVWFSWKDSDFYSLKAVSMMIRPHNFRPRLSP